MKFFSFFVQVFLVICSLTASNFLHAEPLSSDAVNDPWESFNRRIFQFNESFDAYLLRPAAKIYLKITPEIIEKGVGRFFNNLGETTTFANQIFQAKWLPASQTGGRFLMNSTLGLLGFMDVATYFGLPQYDEDFGQTLGYWGFTSGPYLVMPIIGPSSLRDASGFLVSQYLIPKPTDELKEEVRDSLMAINIVQTRARFLSVDSVDAIDKYAFIRGVYLQRRQFFIDDGKAQDEFLEE